MKNMLTDIEIKALKEAKAVEVITDAVATLKTVLWEPMTDSVYGRFENLTEAKAVYQISERDDYFQIANNTLYIALVD